MRKIHTKRGAPATGQTSLRKGSRLEMTIRTHGITEPHAVAVLRNDGTLIPRFGNDFSRRRRKMVYKLGRFLQIVGLILLPVAMAGNLVPEQAVSLGNMLTLMIVGVVIFVMGWILQYVGNR